MLPFFFILPWPSPTLNLFCEPTVYTFFIPSALYWYTRLARLFSIKPLVELLPKKLLGLAIFRNIAMGSSVLTKFYKVVS